MIESKPIIPAPPNTPRYPPAELRLFQVFANRLAYSEATGEEAPDYDPTRRIQRWYDTSKSGPYRVWNDAVGAVVPLDLDPALAATPNFPGTRLYQKYVNPPTTLAIMKSPMGPDQGIEATLLVNLAYVASVLAEINRDLPNLGARRVVLTDPWPFIVSWNGETRRQVNITAGAVEMDASRLLIQRFARGLGSPGKWSETSEGTLVWISSLPNEGVMDLRPEVPVPVRDLLAWEHPVKASPMAPWEIVNEHLVEMPEAGGLTAEQDRILRDIARANGVPA
jgi:hypothetical protein